MKIEDIFENDEIVIMKTSEYDAVYDFTVVNTDVGIKNNDGDIERIITVNSKVLEAD